MLPQLPSAEFRKQYASLSEVTQVTVDGRVIGTWLPGSPRPVAQIRSDGMIDVRAEIEGKLRAALLASGISFHGARWVEEGQAPPTYVYTTPQEPQPTPFVLAIPLTPPERQTPCSCVACSRIDPAGCYGTDELRTPDQLCETPGCVCWGGVDREGSGCYIDGKG